MLRQMRPDKSFRTIWRQDVSTDDIEKDPTWEVVLPEAAQLEEISASLLTPDALPELWPATKQITVADAVNYFAGSKVVNLKRVSVDGSTYDEPVTTPAATADVVRTAVRNAVESGSCG